MLRWTLSVAIGACLALGAEAGVVVVDAAGGGDFTSINAGIAAASNGDIVVVKSGDYRTIDLFGVFANGTSIVIVGHGATRPILNRILVSNVPANGGLVLRGLAFEPSEFVQMYGGIDATQSAGGVFVEDCVVAGANGYEVAFGGPPEDAPPAVSLTNCNFAAFTRCTIVGGRGIDQIGGFNQHGSTAGGIALRLDHSSATLFDCALTGGIGGNGPADFGSHANYGGNGCEVLTSGVRFSGCALKGGRGGNSLSTSVANAGMGGHGLVVPAPSSAESFASTFAGGAGGVATTGASAAAGSAEVLWSPQAHTVLGATARHFSLSTPVLELAPVTVALGGESNDLVFLVQGFALGHVVVGGTVGWLAMTPPLIGPFTFGSVGPTGSVTFSVNAPALTPPTLAGQAFLFQPFFANAQQIVTGPPSCFVLLHL
jgi:hypothetical protein